MEALAQDSDIMSKKDNYQNKLYTEYDKDTFNEINEMLRSFENEKINYQFISSNVIEFQSEDDINENFQSTDMNTLVTKTLQLQSLPIPTPPKKPDDSSVNTQSLQQSFLTEISDNETRLLLKKIRETDRIIQLKKYKKWKAIELRNKKIKIISIKLFFFATKISVKLIGRMLFFDFLQFTNILDATSFLDNPTNGLLFLGFLEMTGSFTYFEIRNLRTILNDIYKQYNELPDEGKSAYRTLFNILPELRKSEMSKLSDATLQNFINTIKGKIPYTSNVYGPDIVFEKIISLDIFGNRSVDDVTLIFKELADITDILKSNTDKIDYIYQNLYKNIILDNTTQVISKVFTSSALNSLIGTSFWKIFSSNKSEYLIKVPGIRTTFFGVLTQEYELPFSFTDMIISTGQTQVTSFINSKIYINPDIKFPTPPPSDDDVWRKKLDSFKKKRKEMGVEESYLLTLDELKLIEKDDTETFAKVYKLKKGNFYKTRLFKNAGLIVACALTVKMGSFIYSVLTGPDINFTNIEKAIYEPSFGFQWLYNLVVYQLGIGVFSMLEVIFNWLHGPNWLSSKIKTYIVKEIKKVLIEIYEDFKKILSSLKSKFVTVKQKSHINKFKKRSLWNLLFSPSILLKLFDIVFFLVDKFIYMLIDLLYYAIPDITTENLNKYLEPEQVYMLFFKLTDFNWNIEEYFTNIFQYITSIFLRSNQTNKDYLHGKLLSDERSYSERFFTDEDILLPSFLSNLPGKDTIEFMMSSVTNRFIRNFKLKKGAGQFLTPTKITGRITMFDSTKGLIYQEFSEGDDTSRDFTPPDINIILQSIYNILKEIPDVYTPIKDLSLQQVKDEITQLGQVIPYTTDEKLIRDLLEEFRKQPGYIAAKLQQLKMKGEWEETSNMLITELQKEHLSLSKSYKQTLLEQFLITKNNFEVILNAFNENIKNDNELGSIFESIIVEPGGKSLLEKISGKDAKISIDVKYLGNFMYKILCENVINNEDDFLSKINSENAGMLKKYQDIKKLIGQFKEVNPDVEIIFSSKEDNDDCFKNVSNKKERFQNLTQSFHNLFKSDNCSDSSCFGSFYHESILGSLTTEEKQAIGYNAVTQSKLPTTDDLTIDKDIDDDTLNLFSLFTMYEQNNQRQFRFMDLETMYTRNLHISENNFFGNKLYMPKRYPISDYFDERAISDYLLEIISMQLKITTGEKEDFLDLKNLLDQLQSRIDYTDSKSIEYDNIFSFVFFGSSNFRVLTYTEFLKKMNDKSQFQSLKNLMPGRIPDPTDDNYSTWTDELLRQHIHINELKLLYYRHKASELGIQYSQADTSEELEKKVLGHPPLLSKIKDFDSQFKESSNIRELLGFDNNRLNQLWENIPEKQFSFMETIVFYIREFFSQDNSELYIRELRKINKQLRVSLQKIDQIDLNIVEQYRSITAMLGTNLFTIEDNLQGPIQKMITDFYNRLFFGESIVSRKFPNTWWDVATVHRTPLEKNFKYFDFCQLLINIILQKQCSSKYESKCEIENNTETVFLPIFKDTLDRNLGSEQFFNDFGCTFPTTKKTDDYNCITDERIKAIINKYRKIDVKNSDEPSIMDIIKLMFYLEDISEDGFLENIKYLDLTKVGPFNEAPDRLGTAAGLSKIKWLRPGKDYTDFWRRPGTEDEDDFISTINLKQEFNKLFRFKKRNFFEFFPNMGIDVDSQLIDIIPENLDITQGPDLSQNIIDQLRKLYQTQTLNDTTVYEILFIKGSIYQFLINNDVIKQNSSLDTVFFSLDIQYFIDFFEKKCDKDSIREGISSFATQERNEDDFISVDDYEITDEDFNTKKSKFLGRNIDELSDNNCALKTFLSKVIIDFSGQNEADINELNSIVINDSNIDDNLLEDLFKNEFLHFFILSNKLKKESKLDIDQLIQDSITPPIEAGRVLNDVLGSQEINEVDNLYNGICVDMIKKFNKLEESNTLTEKFWSGGDNHFVDDTDITNIINFSKSLFIEPGLQDNNRKLFENQFKQFIKGLQKFLQNTEGNASIDTQLVFRNEATEFETDEEFERLHLQFDHFNFNENVKDKSNTFWANWMKETDQDIVKKYTFTLHLRNYLKTYCKLKRNSQDKKKNYLLRIINNKFRRLSNLIQNKKDFFKQFKERESELEDFLKTILNLQTVNQLDFNIPTERQREQTTQRESSQESTGQTRSATQGGPAQRQRSTEDRTAESAREGNAIENMVTSLESVANAQMNAIQTTTQQAEMEESKLAQDESQEEQTSEDLSLLEMLGEMFSFLSDNSNANRLLGVGGIPLSTNPFSMSDFKVTDADTIIPDDLEPKFSEQCMKYYANESWRPLGINDIEKNPASTEETESMKPCVLQNMLVKIVESYIRFYMFTTQQLIRALRIALVSIVKTLEYARDVLGNTPPPVGPLIKTLAIAMLYFFNVLREIFNCFGPILQELLVRTTFLKNMKQKIKNLETPNGILLASIIVANKNFNDKMSLNWYNVSITGGVVSSTICTLMAHKFVATSRNQLDEIVKVAYNDNADNFYNEQGKKNKSVLNLKYNIELISDVGSIMSKSSTEVFSIANIFLSLVQDSTVSANFQNLAWGFLTELIREFFSGNPALDYIMKAIGSESDIVRLKRECDSEKQRYPDKEQDQIRECVDFHTLDRQSANSPSDSIIGQKISDSVNIMMKSDSGKELLFGSRREQKKSSFFYENKAHQQIEQIKQNLTTNEIESIKQDILNDSSVQGCENDSDFINNTFCKNLLEKKINDYVDTQVSNTINQLFTGISINDILALIKEVTKEMIAGFWQDNSITKGPWFDEIVQDTFGGFSILYTEGFFEYFKHVRGINKNSLINLPNSDPYTNQLFSLLQCSSTPCDDDDIDKHDKILRIALLSTSNFEKIFKELPANSDEKKLYLKVFFPNLSIDQINSLAKRTEEYSLNTENLLKHLLENQTIDRQKNAFTFIIYNLINFYDDTQRGQLDLVGSDESTTISNIKDLYEEFLVRDNQFDIVDCFIHKDLPFSNKCKTFFNRRRRINIIQTNTDTKTGVTRQMIHTSSSATEVTESLGVTKKSSLTIPHVQPVQARVNVIDTTSPLQVIELDSDGNNLPDLVILEDGTKMNKKDLDTFYEQVREFFLLLFLQKHCSKQTELVKRSDHSWTLKTTDDDGILEDNIDITCNGNKYTLAQLRIDYERCIKELYPSAQVKLSPTLLFNFLQEQLKEGNLYRNDDVSYNELNKFRWIYGKLITFPIKWDNIKNDPIKKGYTDDLEITEYDLKNWYDLGTGDIKKSWNQLSFEEKKKAEALGFFAELWDQKIDTNTIGLLIEKMFSKPHQNQQYENSYQKLNDNTNQEIAYFNYFEYNLKPKEEDSLDTSEFFQFIKEPLAEKLIKCGNFVAWNGTRQSYNLQNMFDTTIGKQEITTTASSTSFVSTDHEPIDRFILFSDEFLNQWWLTNAELKIDTDSSLNRFIPTNEPASTIFDDVTSNDFTETDDRISLTRKVQPENRAEQLKFITYREADFKLNDSNGSISLSETAYRYFGLSKASSSKSTLIEYLKLIIKNYDEISDCANDRNCAGKKKTDAENLLKIYNYFINYFTLIGFGNNLPIPVLRWTLGKTFQDNLEIINKEDRSSNRFKGAMTYLLENSPLFIDPLGQFTYKRGSKRTQLSSFIFPKFKKTTEQKEKNIVYPPEKVTTQDGKGINSDYERVFKIPLPSIIKKDDCDIDLDEQINSDYKFSHFYDEVIDHDKNTKFYILKKDIPIYQAYDWIKPTKITVQRNGIQKELFQLVGQSEFFSGVPTRKLGEDGGEDGGQTTPEPFQDYMRRTGISLPFFTSGYKNWFGDNEFHQKDLTEKSKQNCDDINSIHSPTVDLLADESLDQFSLSVPDFFDFDVLRFAIPTSIFGVGYDYFIDDDTPIDDSERNSVATQQRGYIDGLSENCRKLGNNEV